MEDLSYQLASKYNQSFADNVMHDHTEAMQCFDCEKLISCGIQAFEMCEICERVIREADAAGAIRISEYIEQQLQQLWVNWLSPVDAAMEFASRVRRNGYDIEKWDKFCEIADIARQRISDNDLLEIGRQSLFESIRKDGDW